MKTDGKVVIGTEFDTSNFEDGIKELTKIKVDDIVVELKPEMSVEEIDKYLDIIDKKVKEMQAKRESYTTGVDGDVVTVMPLSNEEEEYFNNLLDISHDLYSQKEAILNADKNITSEMQQQNEAAEQQQLTNSLNNDELLKMQTNLEEMVQNYNAIMNSKILSEKDLQDAEKLKQDIIELANEIERVSGFKINIKGITDVENGLGNAKTLLGSIGSSIQKITKKVARWGLAIFGVRSAYMAIRQAMSTIASQDKQLAADIEYMKNAIAYTLEPLIRGIVNLAKQLLYYVGYIIQKWTGKNIFENANKSLASANKKANALKKTLASFDELNVLGDENNDAGANLLPSFDLSNLNSMPIPKWVQWIADHKDLFKILGEVLLVAFSASKISKILSNIGTLFGISGGMGLIGLTEILALIATPILIYFTAKGIKEIIDETNKLNDAINANTKASDTNKESHKKYTNTLIEQLNAEKLNENQIKSSIKFLTEHTQRQKEMIQATQDQETWLTKLTGSSKQTEEQYKNMRDELVESINAWNELTAAGKTTKEEQEKFNMVMWENILALEQAGIDTTELRKKYITLSGTKVDIKVETSEAKTGLEKLLNLLDKIFNTKWKYQGNFSISTGTAGGGGSGKGFAKGGIAYKSLPKLASGAILNQPGRGVPYRDAIVGERGAEGILPLTDSQQMALLGEAIGKYVNINATVPVYVGNRMVAREMKKIEAEDNFAFNR